MRKEYALRLGDAALPMAATLCGEPAIVAKDIIPAAVSAPLRAYANSISGSFSYHQKPCSILAAWGRVIQPYACHAHLDKPETVIYRLTNGAFGVKRVKSGAELPVGVTWAVGGMGLLDQYDPAAEGFSGPYADVLRRTAHTFVGTKDELCVLGYVHAMTGAEVNEHVRRLGLDHAVMLDGGHVAAIHSAAAKLNVNQTQFYILQGV